MVMKYYSFKDIYKLNKPFRYVGPIQPGSHSAVSGHKNRVRLNSTMYKCMSCDMRFGVEHTISLGYPNKFVLLEDLNKKPTWL